MSKGPNFNTSLNRSYRLKKMCWERSIPNIKMLSYSLFGWYRRTFIPNINMPVVLILTHLDLSDSRFIDQILSEISKISKLRSLRINGYSSGFRLEPYDFQLLLANLTQLREFDIYSVRICSVIPPNFSSYFSTLRLADAQLHGILPERVLHLPNLKFLDLSQNYQLIVTFPMTKWSRNASLKDLYLYGVNFTKVPEPISNFLGLFDCLTKTGHNSNHYIFHPIP
ncbi:hypothetical protein RND71_014162 [Anisodus tanguticus]|uniref:Uncharacterized protein n=1 Tax=Anisodus tanguticus TaxID=243964 RepID=A0AAE1SAV3_9SOLA|nr:hypothetical protein RND71_014162 [Anisodus tanguticus]